MADKQISIGRIKVPWHEISHESYVSKLTLIFGGSSTGKTTLLEHIMFCCKDHIPNIFVISPTNSDNRTYTGKVPNHCIKSEATKEWFEKLWKRQQELSALYNTANDLAVLKRVASKVMKPFLMEGISAIEQNANVRIAHIENSDDYRHSEKLALKSNIKKEKNDALKLAYKKIIGKNEARLLNMRLSDEEKTAVLFRDLNPRLMLILDDCASKFKKWAKQIPVIKDIFYQGRWKHITTIITSQDDKEIDPELRKNAMVTMFTSSKAAQCSIDRSSSGYTRSEKSNAYEIIDAVFMRNSHGPQHHRKLVYIQDSPSPFSYTVAEVHENFKMGSETLWELDEKLNKKKKKFEIASYPLLSKYGF